MVPGTVSAFQSSMAFATTTLVPSTEQTFQSQLLGGHIHSKAYWVSLPESGFSTSQRACFEWTEPVHTERSLHVCRRWDSCQPDDRHRLERMAGRAVGRPGLHLPACHFLLMSPLPLAFWGGILDMSPTDFSHPFRSPQ